MSDMSKPVVRVMIKLLNGDENCLPKYGSIEASGFDLHASENVTINPNEFQAVGTGVAVKIPDFLELQLRPRSGLSFKTGYLFKNTIGTIDSDYTGELKVCIFNLGKDPLEIKKYDRICQAVLCPVYKADFEIVDELPETDRGVNGFGSTGLNEFQISKVKLLSCTVNK